MTTHHPTTQTPPPSESPEPATEPTTWWEKAIALVDRYGVTDDQLVSVTTHPHTKAVRYRIRSRTRLLRIHTVTLLEPVQPGTEPLISCDCEATAGYCWHVGLVLKMASTPEPVTQPAMPAVPALPSLPVVRAPVPSGKQPMPAVPPRLPGIPALPVTSIPKEERPDRDTALLHRPNKPFSLWK